MATMSMWSSRKGECASRTIARLRPADTARRWQRRNSQHGRRVLVQQKPLPEAEEYLSWRSGYLVFRDRALSEAVNELNRYNTRQLVIDDPSLATLRIGGNFRSRNVDGFARLLEQGGGAIRCRVERRDDGAVLIKARLALIDDAHRWLCRFHSSR